MFSAIFALFLVIVYVLYFRTSLRHYPPGPIPWPLVGNSLSILWRQQPFLHFHSLGKKYGGLFTFYFGDKPTVVVTDTRLGVEGLIEKSDQFGGRPPGQALGSTTDGGLDLAFAQYDHNFVMVKRIAATALRKFSSSDRVERVVKTCFGELSEEWDHTRGAFNPRNSLSRLAVTAALVLLTGRKYRMTDDKVNDIHDSMMTVETMVMSGLSGELLPLLQYFMSDNDQFTELDRKLLAEFQQVCEEKGETLEDFNEDIQADSVAASLLQTTNVDDMKRLSKERCAHILSDFMAGSNSSVTAALLWLIYYSVTNPHAKKRLIEEVDTVLAGKEVRMDDKARMPYTQAFINESLRMRPIMPLALRHYTTTDAKLGGFFIPKNTDIMFSIYSYHHDPLYWADPYKFRPERWLNAPARPRHFMPFGAGVRICPGEALARNLLFLIFVMIIQRYDFNFPIGRSYSDKCLSNTFISTAMARDFEICLARRKSQI